MLKINKDLKENGCQVAQEKVLFPWKTAFVYLQSNLISLNCRSLFIVNNAYQ